eukprot:TRINITY_DN89607_c0_g1_i1.p1 TRINITY_DN89607_c0_g1~~TRINITY_DN89607_c0_g1_i1.p1  ORF type:complete len:113 (+),score=25.94 TRINITY_DN89607_c0_g1_i1:48-341(+)
MALFLCAVFPRYFMPCDPTKANPAPTEEEPAAKDAEVAKDETAKVVSKPGVVETEVWPSMDVIKSPFLQDVAEMVMLAHAEGLRGALKSVLNVVAEA